MKVHSGGPALAPPERQGLAARPPPGDGDPPLRRGEGAVFDGVGGQLVQHQGEGFGGLLAQQYGWAGDLEGLVGNRVGQQLFADHLFQVHVLAGAPASTAWVRARVWRRPSKRAEKSSRS